MKIEILIIHEKRDTGETKKEFPEGFLLFGYNVKACLSN